jgi:hypothetical protein
VAAVTVLLGAAGVLRATHAALGRPAPGEGVLLIGGVVAVAVLAYPVTRALVRRRRSAHRTDS